MSKKIVICIDGTWEQPENKTTHVVRVSRNILEHADEQSQLTLYHEGVGTENLMAKIMGGIYGKGINRMIRQVYRMLVHNYDPGDQIYLFGFSRGAFTVRSLMNLIHEKGVLKKKHSDKIPDLFKAYLNNEHPKSLASHDLFDRAPEIAYVGVWDTVGGHGVPTVWGRIKQRMSPSKHRIELNPSVTSARQALAIHEHRLAFRPDHFDRKASKQTMMEERWFAGAHRDVGGNFQKPSCYFGPLLWIIEGAVLAGLHFDEKKLKFFRECNNAKLVTISTKAEDVVDDILEMTGRYDRFPRLIPGESIDKLSFSVLSKDLRKKWKKVPVGKELKK